MEGQRPVGYAHDVSHERSGRSFLLHGSRQGAYLANDVRKCAKRQLISFSGQEKKAEFCTKVMPSFDRKCRVFVDGTQIQSTRLVAVEQGAMWVRSR